MNPKRMCSQCGEEHSTSYSWFATKKDGGAYICKACAGYRVLNQSTKFPKQGSHTAVIKTAGSGPKLGTTGKFKEAMLWDGR